MNERRITISPKVDRKIYFRFKDLCHAHGIAVERGVEQALKQVLDRAGVTDDGELMENAALAHTKGGGS